MKNIVAMCLLAGAACCVAGEPFEDRWVYVSRNLTKPEHVKEVADIGGYRVRHGYHSKLPQ